MRRGLVRSRSEAARLVEAGRVRVAGEVSLDSSKGVAPAVEIQISEGPRFVSRAGYKLAAALDVFGIDVTGFGCLDVGSSTGGFVDCLLQRGARSVVALDVGREQLASELRQDSRVTLIEQTDIRGVDPVGIGGPFRLVTVDVSFISLLHLIAQIEAMVRPGGEALILVKPQFEVGREKIGRGVVRSDAEREESLSRVKVGLESAGLDTVGSVESALAGESGNRERFFWMRKP